MLEGLVLLVEAWCQGNICGVTHSILPGLCGRKSALHSLSGSGGWLWISAGYSWFSVEGQQSTGQMVLPLDCS